MSPAGDETPFWGASREARSIGIEALQPSLCIKVDRAVRAPIPGGHWVPHTAGTVAQQRTRLVLGAEHVAKYPWVNG